MPNLSEFHDYKKKIAQAFLSDSEFVKLVTNNEYDGAYPAVDLLEQVLSDGSYHSGQVHLYDYIPDVATSGMVHVCIEIDDSKIYHVATAEYIIEIMIIVPVPLMNMYGNIRRDAIASCVDRILNGKTDFGFDRLERRPGSLGIPADKQRSRKLRYSVKGWNMRDEELSHT